MFWKALKCFEKVQNGLFARRFNHFRFADDIIISSREQNKLVVYNYIQ